MVDQQATKRGRKPGKRKIARRVRHRNRIVWGKRVVDAHRLHYPLPKYLGEVKRSPRVEKLRFESLHRSDAQ